VSTPADSELSPWEQMKVERQKRADRVSGALSYRWMITAV
jgi:hypothetical protein